ncbi:putative poly(A) polymerase [Leishmania mexicana MHOM/GT/2001/U1103]|uniref:polynucleotide adenylyltransferase n=1 Tax=Leishmania mexicana (strain MHOM/GT/2001/U1103) TaxID=929439 RepID=E9ALG4_LEIMU|nr:putative poly(A) polymerase [Leishmania mexicana MHOM/GT/2001/U1103]CBZ23768.1 putative poly(A) polymerase [Leishmania mexicana MHOM/GT/2001/U1103]
MERAAEATLVGDAFPHFNFAADAAASTALRRATDAFSMEKTDEVVRLVRQLLEKLLQAEPSAAAAWTQVYVFGSSGLGAAITGSDIDLIALCSASVNTSLFFQKFPRSAEGRLQDVVVVTSARVPLIKFSYNGVHVDLLFASVDMRTAPDTNELLRDDFLSLVSLPCRATVNGIRTILEIRRRLPLPLDAYACVLRAVKYWAARRQVYGNLYTFPNGVCLAIMVARACQLCPVADSSVILRFFFSLYVWWLQRGTRIDPVSIVPTDENVAIARVPGMPPPWDAVWDAADLFPVLNPARPTVNAAHAVGRSGLQLFLKELLRAEQLCSLVPMPYSALWEPYNVLDEHRFFVGVHISSEHQSLAACEDTINAWKGYVESKLRMFVYALECVAEVRPFPCPVVDEPPRAVTRRGVTVHCRSRAFFFGVRNGNKDVAHSDVESAFREFEFAVTEGTTGKNPFVWNRSAMLGPRLSFFSIYDPLTADSPCQALYSACAEMMGSSV